MVSAPRALVAVGSVLAIGLAAHTAANLRHLRRPDPQAPPVDEPVTVLIPARDEEQHLATTVRSVLEQTGVPDLSVLVLDDGSTDATGVIADGLAAADHRVTVIHGDDVPAPPGWLGKPWACARLADRAQGTVLVFVDADVVLEPHAVRALHATLRGNGLSLVAPYPRQLAGTWLERLVQPLVTWSWAATMPLRWAERSLRPSLSAANGQLLAFDAADYRAMGGHGAVRDDVLEDVGLMRAMKRSGRHTATVDGSHLASCRMYDSPQALVDGYAKSLWTAFNGPAGSAGATALLVLVYTLPALAAVAAPSPRTRALGVVGYAAGVASRALVARRTGEPVLPDTLAQPVSIAAFAALTGVSWWRHARGTNTWKGRAVVAHAGGRT